MDYPIKISCCNCYFVAEYVVDRGTLHSEASLECPNCGCRPNEGKYEVIAFAGDSKHSKKEVDGN